MKKAALPILILLALSVAAYARSSIIGGFGPNQNFYGFDGRFPLGGGIGQGSGPPPTSCTGTLDLTEGCVFPMLGS